MAEEGNISAARKRILWIVGLVILALIVLGTFSDWITEWLWLKQLDYSQVFWTIKRTQILLLVLAFVVTVTYVGLNLRVLGKQLLGVSFVGTPLEQTQLDFESEAGQKAARIFGRIATLIAGVLMAMAFFYRWDSYFRFHWDTMVGQADPIFQNDLGFYLFRLPFIEILQNSLIALVFIVTLGIIVLYLYTGRLTASNSLYSIPQKIRRHISVNLAIWFLLLAWGYYLDRYDILYDESGAVYGAGYTDVTVRLPLIWIMMIFTGLLGLITAVQWFINKPKWIVYGGVGALVIGVLGLGILPSLVQSFKVDPNELELETPYIKNNINQTRSAYELDQAEVISYNARDTLSRRDITRNEATIDNVRLWDPRLLIQTYRQLQEIRTYYQFYSVDIDRYWTEEGYRQMMLAPRELSNDLAEKTDTWVNQKLQYTHGYGMVMSPVAEEGQEGIPPFTVKDLPPQSTDDSLQVDQAAIYYGENQEGFRIVNTGIKELDYPSGDENVYTNYDGQGGIPFSNWFRKLLFAWQLGDINILLSDYIKDDSRIQIWQRVQERVKKVVPFLTLDEDPYLVLNNGKIYWIQDAYTTSPHYPYSEPYQRNLNYIRNSVKVVVDAYDGDVDFYVSNENDPIIQVYQDIFPDVFQPLSAMPEGLKRHVRYPLDLFKVQVDKYRTYHMTNPQVFYNNEDLWTLPQEKYSGRTQRMEPYYVLSKLPDQDELQYMLITPYTPENRDNMIAWMAAQSDFPNYGKLKVYNLPKERLIYGPNQIEARIDQSTEISRQLTLWDQRGSRVIRGNLIVIPIENAFLYVEPVFLISEGVDIPQLQRVIVSDGQRIAMEPTLRGGLNSLYGEQIVEERFDRDPGRISVDTSAVSGGQVQQAVQQQQATPSLNGELDGEASQRLRQLWNEAQNALRQGDWETFGQKMEQMDKIMGGQTN